MPVKISICKRRNTCFECDDKKCLHAGDITADCPLNERTRAHHCRGECHECNYNLNNWNEVNRNE